MNTGRVWNFAAGPSVLPEAVLKRAQKEMLNWNGSGMSVMEMSHRSAMFTQIFDHAQSSFRTLMHIPSDYHVLFLQGGASTQFSMVPLNLMRDKGSADYAVTGHFSSSAAKEARKYGNVHIAHDCSAGGFRTVPSQEELVLDPSASYFHYCANNTIFGTEWHYVPDTGNVPLVCDMSSNIASCEVDVSRYGLIYAGAQKNLAPAGLTIVIIRDDLALCEHPDTPLMLSYRRMIDKNSMFNTPPCWNIYIFSLVMDWIEENGGIAGMEARRKERAGMLYDYLDQSKLFHAHAEKSARSFMNVTFRTEDPELDAQFVKEASEAGFANLKGHRLAGGMRASIYNAMEPEGVKQLCGFMESFEKKHI
ncbi:MAG: 3-phosphoserine/phosphohydroxythreonine transaminase [Erysipelotrichaceae bacterium]|nr:3-phosphoserine/phosphohydroxythreonine transaminase [Erysipelotrichaceae bacterium]